MATALTIVESTQKEKSDWRHLARLAAFIGTLVLAILLLFDCSLRAETAQYQAQDKRENLYTRPANSYETATEVAVIHQQVEQNTNNIQNLWRTFTQFQKDVEDRDREQEKSLNRIEGGGSMFLAVIAVLQALGIIKNKK